MNSENMNWWSRNWKWFVPVGCIGLMVVFAMFFAAIFIIVVSSMKSSWAYSEALSMAQRNDLVIEWIGEPIETGTFVSGSISVSGPSGEAELAIPIHGSRGSGTLYVVAKKQAGRWRMILAEIEVDGVDDRIDLLQPSGAEPMLLYRPGRPPIASMHLRIASSAVVAWGGSLS